MERSMTEIKRHFWKELPLFNFVEFFLTSNVKWVVKGVLCKHNQTVARHMEYKRAEKVTVSTYFLFINRPSIYCFDLITPKLITLFGCQFKIKSSDRISADDVHNGKMFLNDRETYLVHICPAAASNILKLFYSFHLWKTAQTPKPYFLVKNAIMVLQLSWSESEPKYKMME